MKKRVRIGLFRSFFNLEQFCDIFHFLVDDFEFVQDQDNPDVGFVVCFGPDWLDFGSLPRAKKLVFFDMEPQSHLDLSPFDYAITLNRHFDQTVSEGDLHDYGIYFGRRF